MENVIDYVETVEKSKKEKAKQFVVTKYESGKRFVKEHGKEIIVAIPVVVGGITSIVKLVKPSAYEKERKRIDTTYYDPSTGLHWDLKRKLTNNEREELDQRRRDGEPVGNILRDMKVAKR